MPTTLPNAAALWMRAQSAQDAKRQTQQRERTDESREDKYEKRRRRIDESQQQASIALLAPNRPIELDKQSEERIEVGSRAFRRETAVADGRRQIQQDQTAFRDALRTAREQSSQSQAGQLTNNDTSNEATGGKNTPPSVPQNSPDAKGAAAATSAAPAASTTSNAATTASQQGSVTQSPAQTVDASKGGTATSAQVHSGLASTTAATVVSTQAVTNAASQGNPTNTAASAADATPKPGAVDAAKGAQSSESGSQRGADRVESVASPSGGSSRAGERFDRTLGSAKAQASADADAAESRENIDRLVRVVRAQIVSGRGSTVLKLDPPNLGNLRVEIDLQRDGLSVRMNPETELAHRLLSQGVEDLRRDLRAAGIELAHVDIRPPSATTVVNEAAAGWNSRQMTDQDDAATRRDDRDDQLNGFARTRMRGREGLTRGTEAAASAGTPSVSMDASTGPTAESRVNVLA